MNNVKITKNSKEQQKQAVQIKDLEQAIELNEKSLGSANGGQDQWKQAAKIISEMP